MSSRHRSGIARCQLFSIAGREGGLVHGANDPVSSRYWYGIARCQALTMSWGGSLMSAKAPASSRRRSGIARCQAFAAHHGAGGRKICCKGPGVA